VSDYGRPELLVDSAWLEAHQNDPNLRIVDCDSLDAYRRAHIPGAVPIPGDQTPGPTQANFLKNPENPLFVMTPDQFAARMASMGIGDETEVVAYDASSSNYAGRLWWCLTYYGHTRVRILNGGWRRWLAEKRPVAVSEPKVAPASFTPRPNASVLASAEYVKAAYQRPDVVVLDVRTDGEWAGTNNRGNKRGGHIPGAVHLEWLNNLAAERDQAFKTADELQAMYAAAGVTPDKEVITVCQGGIRAAQAAATLTLMGYTRVRNYDGSFREWGNRDDTPITT
jgi:thiosulfate/3-mercaptopyruvate sulfurtransferase